MQFIDDAEFQIAIDDDTGARIPLLNGEKMSLLFLFVDRFIPLVGMRWRLGQDALRKA